MTAKRIHLASILAIASLAISSSTLADLERLRPIPSGQKQVNALFDTAGDVLSISEQVGALPSRCMESSPTLRLCEWLIDRPTPAWKSLAEAIDTAREHISLLCAVTVGGELLAPGGCTAYPRYSNRNQFRILNPSSRDETTRERGAEYRLVMSGWIENAQTVYEVSRLMGFLPDRCFDVSASTQVCVWRTNSGTYGHGTVATWLGAPKSARVRLQCAFPKDGSARAPGSCQAAVDS